MARRSGGTSPHGARRRAGAARHERRGYVAGCHLSRAGDLDSAALPDALPGYLIHLNARLRLDGVPAGEAGSFVMGAPLLAETVYTAPENAPERTLTAPVAGEYRPVVRPCPAV